MGPGTDLSSNPIHPENRLAKELMESLLDRTNQSEPTSLPVFTIQKKVKFFFLKKITKRHRDQTH